MLVSVKAKPFREENKAYDSLVESYTSLLGTRSYNAVQWFFTNVSRATKNGHKGLKVRLKADYWSGNVCNIGYRKVKEVLDWFEYNEFITVYLGNSDYRAEWKSYPTIVKFNDKLIDLLDLEQLKLYVPEDRLQSTILVKDRKTKEEIMFVATEETIKMEAEMTKYNESFRDVLIEFNGQEVPALEYKRSFSGDLYKGGRLFAHGGSIQLLPEKFRLEYLTLDKEPVCEIDYKAIHACILYESEAQKDERIYKLARKGFDPYAADQSVVEVDEKAVVKHTIKYGIKKYDPVRNLYKISLMMALNCDSSTRARQSINHELYKDSKLDECDKRYVGLVNPDSEAVLEALCEHNELIQDYFYKDYGIVLQNIDSRIALRVIDYLIQEGHTCLAYHDSFAVKESIAPFLDFAMHAAWKDVLGENQFCFAEVK
jgi:hypothetical protein